MVVCVIVPGTKLGEVSVGTEGVEDASFSDGFSDDGTSLDMWGGGVEEAEAEAAVVVVLDGKAKALGFKDGYDDSTQATFEFGESCGDVGLGTPQAASSAELLG